MRTWLTWSLVVFGVLLLGIQLVPYGHRHDNPPVVSEPRWSIAEVRTLAVRACFDCHSNETRWPWYANVAPVSWLLQHDVDEGRQELNFSEWNRAQPEAKEAAQSVRTGEMPPVGYLLLHRDAHLNARELEQLIDGLAATLGSEEEMSWRTAPAGSDGTARAAP